jgi:hypothetical protein
MLRILAVHPTPELCLETQLNKPLGALHAHWSPGTGPLRRDLCWEPVTRPIAGFVLTDSGG